MSTRTSLAKLALRALADAPAHVVPPTPRDEDDAALAIARELDAIRARRRRRARIAVALSFAAAAAVALGVGLARRRPSGTAVALDVSGSVVVMRGESGSALERGAAVAQGDRIVASAKGSSTLRLRKGSELRTIDGADVVVAEQGKIQIFDLRAGAVELHVSKLEPDERFIVRTSDAEVEVRGTMFRVAIGERCAGTTTHVAVTEGVVAVRSAGSETRVRANESWPEGCSATTLAAPPAAPTMATPPATATPTATPTATATAMAAASSARKAAPPIASSNLAEQNALFAEAMAAKRRGDSTAALAALDRLAASHPNGPLAESAAVERMRILAAVDPARASDAARAYLARHPKGYARDEARKLAGMP